MRFWARVLAAVTLLSSVLQGALAADEWIPFNPPADTFAESPIDLRSLNERVAGENGWMRAQGGRLLLGNGQPVRLWGVNGPPHDIKDPAELRRVARGLAKRGVNLVRIHGAIFDKEGEVDPAKVQHLIDVVEAMKLEGIYSHASIYFPLWFRPGPHLTWLKGYDGARHPFAALMFNREFEAKYQSWWKAVMQTPGARSGRKLADEPALMGVEAQNEDSFFFWTFNEQNLPDPQLRILEAKFGEWLTKKHGSIQKAFDTWKSPALKRDAPGEGRVAFRPLWSIANEKTLRDQDTAAFLLETQTLFYERTVKHLRGLGFKGLFCASNWSTASPEVLGPLEKLSYMMGDIVDRHGYFGGLHNGENSAWSIRNDHVYTDRSALRFDNPDPAKPRLFTHPAMDIHYNDAATMISETTWTRPNRYRSEAPLYYALFGVLQHSDAVIHFAHDGANWNVKPNFWMQPWTLTSPAMFGQFPAAAAIFRRNLIALGDTVAEVNLNTNELRALKGTPLPQEASLDELRLKDVPPANGEVQPGQRLDPLLHYLSRTHVRFSGNPSKTEVKMGQGKIDREAKRLVSSTGQLELDWGQGLLTINAPQAQGVSGHLQAAGAKALADIVVESPLELGHIIVIPLDNQPLAKSARMLVQVMSEEQNSGWKTEPTIDGKKKIVSIGQDPWTIRPLAGTVRFKRDGALKITALDHNGYPTQALPPGTAIQLRPDTLYYLVEGR
ncbi:MAG TPA: hypothetical protein VEH27_04790 [Methylomirabilota bacterium]|nr:hypothetical protein [Methylomirabilota bacterium]